MHDELTESPQALLDATLDISVPLHEAIKRFDEEIASYQIAGPCGVGFFRREGDQISHESSSPAEELIPFIHDLRDQHLHRVRAGSGADNSHLIPLLLMCLFIVDPVTRERFSLSSYANRPAVIDAITEEDGKHDPPLEHGDGALRAWVPLEAAHAPGAGVHTAVLEMVFPAGRAPRYAPW
jgi:hypothetical protein